MGVLKHIIETHIFHKKAIGGNNIYIFFIYQIYFCIPEIFKSSIKNRFLSTKLPFEFVF